MMCTPLVIDVLEDLGAWPEEIDYRKSKAKLKLVSGSPVV